MILNGEVVDHDRLIIADAILHAIPLRTSGIIPKWKKEFEVYPQIVQDRLIGDTLDAWMYPLHIDTCWETSPQHRIKFFEYLLGDVYRVLRLVFAINRIWEPDWKRLETRLLGMNKLPAQLISRIHEILEENDLFVARAECFKLILETLSFVPPRFEVSRACDIITKSLVKHGVAEDSEPGEAR